MQRVARAALTAAVPGSIMPKTTAGRFGAGLFFSLINRH